MGLCRPDRWLAGRHHRAWTRLRMPGRYHPWPDRRLRRRTARQPPASIGRREPSAHRDTPLLWHARRRLYRRVSVGRIGAAHWRRSVTTSLRGLAWLAVSLTPSPAPVSLLAGASSLG